MDLRYFVVGAGAIGCEMLKNLAMLGVGCGPRGAVAVTDMDKIERSNLSRQFLFRASHIDQLCTLTCTHSITHSLIHIRTQAHSLSHSCKHALTHPKPFNEGK